MPVMPIPDDWDGQTWDCILVEWPDSVAWRALLRGLVTTPARGRFWDGRTGTIKDAQDIGREIEERNPIVSCQEIVTVLQQIKASIDAIDVSNTATATATANIDLAIQNQTTAIVDQMINQEQSQEQSQQALTTAVANAYAFSQAFAQTWVGVEIKNQVNNILRPVGGPGLQPPTAEETTQTTVTAVAADPAEVEACRRVYWLLDSTHQVYHRLNEIISGAASGLLSMGGVLSEALAVIAFRISPETSPILIPLATLTGTASLMAQLYEEGVLTTVVSDMDLWLESEFESLWCSLFQAYLGNLDTKVMQDLVLSSFAGYTSVPAASAMVKLTFNLSALATLWYVSNLIPTYPAIPAPYGDNWCSNNCLE